MSGMTAMTIAACVVGLALGAALLWFLFTRGSRAATLTETDFDAAYDDLVAKGEITEPDRAAAWRDFDAQQLAAERDRLRWEQAAEE